MFVLLTMICLLIIGLYLFIKPYDDTLKIIGFICMIIGVVGMGMSVFYLVYTSDMPLWLKILILK